MSSSVSPEEYKLAGQVVHIRRVSKRLCFIDLFCEDEGSSQGLESRGDDVSGASRRRSCAILKSWVCGDGVMSSALRGENKIHCGDNVVFSGKMDETGHLLVSSYHFINRWKDSRPGEQFLPIPPPMIHESTSESPCKFWLNTGNCPKGEECKFRHQAAEGTDLSGIRASYVNERLSSRMDAQLNAHHQSGDLDHTAQDLDDPSTRHQRATIFARWLCEEFADILHQENKDGGDGGIVLDVAGGRKADISHELLSRLTADLRLICVDPRAQEEAGTCTLRSLPKWKAKRRRKEQQDEKRWGAPELLPRTFNEPLLSEFGDRQRVVLLVAMHPDQATEDVVDAGLRNNIPFAVVPCCVFAHLDSRRPTTYEGFLEYLAGKHAGVKRARLNFRGRDTVLYWKGSRD